MESLPSTISEDPYSLGLHHSMAIPHSDKPFPTLKIGLLNPNGMSSVSRTDQNNNTYQLNKLQVLLQDANTLGLSILGLSETHHFKSRQTCGNSPLNMMTRPVVVLRL